jgi:hypothetical protein
MGALIDALANPADPTAGYGDYQAVNDPTSSGTNWAGVGSALQGALGAYGQYKTGANTQAGINTASNQAQTGIQNAMGTVNNLYQAGTNLTTPFIQAGAGVGNQIQQNVNPYVGAGQQAIGNLQNLQGAPLDVNSFLDPSMQFTMQQGMNAIQGSAAARGGVLSGSALKDLTSYASGLASQNYGNAVTNALADRSQRANIGSQLYQGGLAGTGLLTPIANAGVQALGYQMANTGNTQSDLAQLNQNLGQTQANYTGQAVTANGGANSTANKIGQAGQLIQAGSQLYNAVGGSEGISNAVGAISDWFSDEQTKTQVEPIHAGDLSSMIAAGMQGPQAVNVAVHPMGSSGTSIQNVAPQAGTTPAGTTASGTTASPAPQAAQTDPHAQAEKNLGMVGSAVGSYFGGPIGSAIGKAAGSFLGSIFSDENTKQDISALSSSDINRSLDGMHAKTYEYTQQAQSQLGTPAGKQVGVIAQDVQKTPAGSMVNRSPQGPLEIDGPKAMSFALAAVAELNKRLNAVEKSRK